MGASLALLALLTLLTGCSGGVEGQEPGECLDRIDNDGNGLTDCDDGGCMGWEFCDPSGGGDGGTPGGTGGDDTGGATPPDDTAPPDDTGGDTARPSGDAAWRALCINEFMASNARGLQDVDGSYPDWVELHNSGEVALDLVGGFITDDLDEPEKHQLPSLIVDAGGFLILYADGDDTDGGQHLSFSLSADGESLALYAPGGERIDALSFPEQVSDTAAFRTVDCGDEWSYTTAPTPGETNE